MSALGRAHGKLILVGEHAVVYGHPAIAFAVDLETRVTVEVGGSDLDSEADDEPLRRAIAQTFGPGHSVTIRGELPVGRGMGSSAALSVALIRARNKLRGQKASAREVFEDALELERIFHHHPSGLDVAVSVRGGSLRYVKGEKPLPLPPPAGRIVVLDTGVVSNTAALVQGVMSRRPWVDSALNRIGALVDEAAAVLKAPAALGALMNENHALLREIGVSTPELDALVTLATDAGAYGAKLSGAGGGGVAIALVDDPEPVLRAAARQEVRAWACAPARS